MCEKSLKRIFLAAHRVASFLFMFHSSPSEELMKRILLKKSKPNKQIKSLLFVLLNKSTCLKVRYCRFSVHIVWLSDDSISYNLQTTRFDSAKCYVKIFKEANITKKQEPVSFLSQNAKRFLIARSPKSARCSVLRRSLYFLSTSDWKNTWKHDTVSKRAQSRQRNAFLKAFFIHYRLKRWADRSESFKFHLPSTRVVLQLTFSRSRSDSTVNFFVFLCTLVA